MRIIVSKAYLKWRKANKSNIALGAIDKFLTRVALAPDAASIIPQPKAVGNNLRKVPGVVDEFSLAKEYRVYSKCLELTPGVVTFCLAIVGSKGVKNQSNSILTALGMFDDINAVDWAEWEPAADVSQTQNVAESVEPEPVVSDNTTPDVKARKNKGKPVDENGMTVAERKALQKKQRQEQMALARQVKKQRQLAKQQEQTENQPPVATNVVENKAAPVVATAPESAADSVPVVSDEMTHDVKAKTNKGEPADENGMTDAERKALQKKQRQEQIALARQIKKQRQLARQQEELAKQQEQMENQPVVATPVATNAVENKAAPVVATAPESAADTVSSAEPVQPTGNTVDFKDYTDIQYQLEIIGYKMNIERLNIEIAQHKIELEKLAMQRLELLRMNKTKSM